MTAPKPQNEEERLAALRSWEILDTPCELGFDDLTYLAAMACQTPIALVSLVDENRQWFKSCIGLSVQETSRDLAFCAHAILDPGFILVVEDATKDPRFLDNELVTGPPFIRFYAGAPLVDSHNHTLGTLCVIDTIARSFTDSMRRALSALARQVVLQIETRKANEEQARLTEYLLESEDRFRSAIEAMNEGFVLQERSGEIVVANLQAERILGLSLNQLLGKTSYDPGWRAIHEDGRDFLGTDHPAMRSLQTGQKLSNVIMGVHKPSGELTWISINSSPLFRAADHEPYAVVATFADITRQLEGERLKAKHLESLTESKSRLEEENSILERLTSIDELTGLKNVRRFRQQLNSAIRRSQRLNLPISLLMIDVDRFKQFNDSFGHPAGDTVLRQVGAILEATARSSDSVARYGGEEFVVLLPNCPADQARTVAERFRAAIEAAEWPQRQVTASIGVATHLGGWADGVALVEEADQALYRSKQQGRNRVTHANDREQVRVPLHALVY